MIPQRILALGLFASLLASACGGSSESGTEVGSSAGTATAAQTSLSLTPTGEIRTAKISELKNDVDAKTTSTDDWLTASEGEQIIAGGGVRTGDESRVRIDTSDQSIIRIAANTEFELMEFSPQPDDPVTRLKLDTGKVWVWVTRALGQGTFEVETPSGVATVRGSLMSVEFDRLAGRLAVTCLEGECELRDRLQNAVRLLAGEASEVPGAGLAPRAASRMTRAQLRDWIDNFPEAAEIARRLLALLGDETPTPPGGSGGSGGTGQTACDHPYFPMRPGATWTYSTESGPLTWTIESVAGDASQATAVMTFNIADITGTYNWQCDAGGITSFDFGTLSSAEFGQFSNLQVTRSSGVWLPAAELLTPGYGWALAYDVEMQMTIPGGGGEGSGTTSFSEQNSVASANPVTVDGQTYDGLQITRSGSQTMQATVGGFSVPAVEMAIDSAWELARGVGIVRWTSRTEGQTSTSELVSFSVP